MAVWSIRVVQTSSIILVHLASESLRGAATTRPASSASCLILYLAINKTKTAYMHTPTLSLPPSLRQAEPRKAQAGVADVVAGSTRPPPQSSSYSLPTPHAFSRKRTTTRSSTGSNPTPHTCKAWSPAVNGPWKTHRRTASLPWPSPPAAPTSCSCPLGTRLPACTTGPPT